MGNRHHDTDVYSDGGGGVSSGEERHWPLALVASFCLIRPFFSRSFFPLYNTSAKRREKRGMVKKRWVAKLKHGLAASDKAVEAAETLETSYHNLFGAPDGLVRLFVRVVVVVRGESKVKHICRNNVKMCFSSHPALSSLRGSHNLPF